MDEFQVGLHCNWDHMSQVNSAQFLSPQKQYVGSIEAGPMYMPQEALETYAHTWQALCWILQFRTVE